MSPPVLERLRRRKLVQWGIAYLAGSWLVLQVLSLLAQPFAWPDLVLRAATVLLGVGFSAVLVLAWYHGEKGAQRVSGVELLMLAGILVVAAAAVAFVRRDRRDGRPPAGGEEAAAPAAAPAEQGSIAVLPFADLSPKSDQEYFADGLAEELLNVLSHFPELRVASRTSAFSFKGQEVRVDSIGRALHVAYVLEGSVRKAGEQVRITAQLIDAATGYHRWSDTYDRELKDVFAVQDEISRAIVAELRLQLSDERTASPLARSETADPEAHNLLLRAIAARWADTPEAVRASIDLLRQVTERDPDYARAHAELASSLFRGAYMRYVAYPAGYDEARREASRALALDSTLAEAYDVLGRVAEWRDWDWSGADGYYRQALAHNPNDAGAYRSLAALLNRLGKPDEATAAAQRALAIDPLSPLSFNALGNTYVYAGRYQDAVRSYRDGLALQPASVSMLVNLALVYSESGRHPEALSTIQRALELTPGVGWANGMLGYIEARAGHRAAAERALAQLRKAPDASPYLSAAVEAALGRKEAAIALLERSYALRDDFLPDLGVDPAFASLRGDPRVQRMLREARLSH